MATKKYVPALQVSPNDSTDLSYTASKLFIGGSGNLKVTLADGTVATFTSVPVGVFPRAVQRVWSTGTTATGIVGLAADGLHKLPDGSVVSTLV